MITINRILIWIFTGLVTGISLAEWGDIWWLLILLLFIAFLALLLRRPIIIVLATVAVFGFAYWEAAHPQHPGLQKTYLTGARVLVLDRPHIREGKLRFVGLIQEEGFKVRVFLPPVLPLEKGDLLEVNGSLREIKGPTNPGDFNFKEYWAHRDVFYNLLVTELPPPRVVANQSSFGGHLLARVIKRGHQAIDASMTGEQVVLLEGMLFGFQGEISEEQYVLFQKSGLVHVFSVSGFHVGFIVLIGIWAANRLGKRKSTRFLIVLTLLTVYGFMTAWPSPMVRASIMACLGLAAHYFGREEDLPTSLAMAGIVLLLLSPANLFTISFQLSFLATWGLIYLYPRWKEITGVHTSWGKAVLLCLAPQVATLPLAAYYFNLVSLISVVSNLLLVNVAGSAVTLGFLGVVAAQFSQVLASFFMVPAGFLTAIVQGGSVLLGKIPGSFLWVAQPALWSVFAAYLGMILLWGKFTIRKDRISMNSREGETETVFSINGIRRSIGLCLILIFAVSLLMPGQLKAPGVLRVVFLDVGQGDAVFIKTPRGFTILVDGGGSELFDVGQEVVLPYLRRQGIRKIDLAIATHPHIDHLQGLKSVLKECPARVVVAGESCYADLCESGSELVSINGLQEISLDRASRMWIWAPEPGGLAEPGNDTSVISKIIMGDISFLLTGDAEAA
ncbi:MAG: ComEC/Rec2 family competence protein, partial [Bacillota bacterium]